ncbi:hypothetical protein [Streptomyces glaucus]|uniref:Uncharacterized protein n=1 Tax=Streptomyces glaucus TaxID=284029 RepID=A0ABP5WQG6_9ACTN
MHALTEPERADVVGAALDDATLTTNSYDEYAADVQARPCSQFACFALPVAGSKSAVRSLALYGA